MESDAYPPNRYGGAAVRRQEIIRKVLAEGYASFEQLAALLHVSARTVRRDIALLDRDGALTMVSGGAKVSEPFLQPMPFSKRKISEPQLKAAMAQQVRKLIKPDEAVGVDAGTTAAFVAREITAVPGVTIISNSLEVMQYFETESSGSLIAIGGSFDAQRRAFFGPMARAALESLRLSTSILGCSGVHPGGFGCAAPADSEIKKILLSISDRRILVATSPKFERSAPVRFGDFSEIDVLVTDDRVRGETLSKIAAQGVEIMTVTATDLAVSPSEGWLVS